MYSKSRGCLQYELKGRQGVASANGILSARLQTDKPLSSHLECASGICSIYDHCMLGFISLIVSCSMGSRSVSMHKTSFPEIMCKILSLACRLMVAWSVCEANISKFWKNVRPANHVVTSS